MAERKIHILFMCASNACRSQMAEGFAEKFKSDVIEAFSAGYKPATRVSRNAIKVMVEAGVDMTDFYPKHLDDLAGLKFDYVVTMCDSINQVKIVLPEGAKLVHQSFEDPSTFIGGAEETLDRFRKVRDEIKDFVMSLPDSLS